MIRRSALLLLTSFALGSVLAAQEVGKEVDSRTVSAKGAEVDGLLDVFDAGDIRTEEEADAAFDRLAAQGEADRPNDAARFLATRDDLSIFLMLLEQADLIDSLTQGDREITIFAPNDAAFAAMDAEEFTILLEGHAALRDFLQRHIVTGDRSTSSMAVLLQDGGQMGVSGPGAKVAVESSVAGGGPAGGPASETVADGSAGDEPEIVPAEIPAVDPRSAIRLESRSGTTLLVGTRPAVVRAELLRLDDSRPPQVAGGGAADPLTATLYVGNAEIVEPDLSIDGLTVHIIDRVLLPTSDDAAVGR